MGDDAADTMIEYAVALGRKDSADSVSLNVLDAQGEPHVVVFLVGPATMMTVESSTSTLEEPDNSAAIQAMNERIALTVPPPLTPAPLTAMPGFVDDI